MSGRLYHHPYFSSSRPLLLIYELNLPVEVVTFESMADLKSPEFLKLHPQGKVPVYIEGTPEKPDFVLTESSAIVLYLLEKYDKDHKLLPKDPQQRARVYQFGSFGPSEAYHTLVPLVFQKEAADKGESTDAHLIATKNLEWETSTAPLIVSVLGDKPYLLGDEFSAADLLISYDLMAAVHVGVKLDPKLQAYVQKLSSREAFKKVFPDV